MNLEILNALKDTLIMILIPTLFAIFLGIPLGSLLFLTNKGSIKENMRIYIPANIYVNVVRSFPFLILVVVLMPVARLIFGTAFGLIPASFPICVVAVALYARFVEQSFYDVLGLTSSIISFISYSTVMGVVGGGGIGDYAMRYGYNEYNYALVFKMVAIMIIIVFSIQILGNYIAKKLDKRRRNY